MHYAKSRIDIGYDLVADFALALAVLEKDGSCVDGLLLKHPGRRQTSTTRNQAFTLRFTLCLLVFANHSHLKIAFRHARCLPASLLQLL